jgi:hypothetical protein
MNNFTREFMAVGGTKRNQFKFLEESSVYQEEVHTKKTKQNSRENTRKIIYGQRLIYSHIILCKLKQMNILS